MHPNRSNFHFYRAFEIRKEKSKYEARSNQEVYNI